MKPKIGIGFRIGKLTVSEPTGERKNGYMVWNCTCDCGGAIQLDTRALQRGTVRDCGCETKVKPGQKDLTGQRFGRLVCLEPSPHRNKQGGTQWLCQCDCGKQCLAATHQLLCGYKKSCGCLSHPPLKDYVGKRFGMLTVLEYAGKWDSMHRWRCLCDCGNETTAEYPPSKRNSSTATKLRSSTTPNESKRKTDGYLKAFTPTKASPERATKSVTSSTA